MIHKVSLGWPNTFNAWVALEVISLRNADATSPKLIRIAVDARNVDAITQLRKVWTARISLILSTMLCTQTRLA